MSSSSEQIQPTRPEGKRNAWSEDEPPPRRPIEPGSSEGGSALFALLFVSFHTLLIAGFIVGAIVYGPRSAKVFRDFNMKVSPGTEIAFGVSRWISNYWYVLVLFLLPCLFADGMILFLLHRSRRTRPWSYVWALAVILLPLVLAGCMGGAIFSSYLKLMEGLRAW